MEINEELLKKLSQLSALSLSSEEKESMKAYLKETLSHFEKIKEVETKGIEPLISPFEPPLRMREDKVRDFPDKKSLLDQAPQKQALLVKAPPVV